MKSNYLEPMFEIILFKNEDIILASGANPKPITDESGIEHSHYY